MTGLFEPAPEANILWMARVDSTNEMAARLIRAMAEDEERLADTVIVADMQTEGRGREGNRWVSPAGGLYATWLGWLPTAALTWLPMAMGAILAEAVELLVPTARVRLKWPNDLIAEGGKLGGILCQSRVSGESAWALAGFGVNIEGEAVLAATDATAPISLRALGWRGTPDEARGGLVRAVISGLRPALADSPRTREAWVRRSALAPGELVRVRTGGTSVAGTLLGFGEEGQLLVEIDGARVAIPAGELVTPLDG
ncbi:MAG: biotin--[acetyl-CoA-carboxylase] ligase [Acidobacteriota bacterium]